jgi:hypothetical protein
MHSRQTETQSFSMRDKPGVSFKSNDAQRDGEPAVGKRNGSTRLDNLLGGIR